MLNIWFGKNYPGGRVIRRVDFYFDNMKQKSWFNDKFNQEMIKDIDKTIVLKDFALENKILGGISPDKLSGGVKTLILIKEIPEETFDLTNCGENCFKWIFKMCENIDRTVVLNYVPLGTLIPEKFEVKILNSNKIVHNAKELSMEAIKPLEPKQLSKEQEEFEDACILKLHNKLMEKYMV